VKKILVIIIVQFFIIRVWGGAKKLLLLILFFFSTLTANVIICKEEGNQTELNQCTYEHFLKVDKELNSIYEELNNQPNYSNGIVEKVVEKYACENFYYQACCDYAPLYPIEPIIESKAEVIVKKLIRQQEMKLYIGQTFKMEREQRIKEKLKQQQIHVLKQDNGEIVRKKYSKAWKTYDVNSTIEALYGKSFKKHTDFKKHTEIYELFNFVSLSPKFPIKSLALLQKSDFDPTLIAFFNVSKETLVDYRVKVFLDKCGSKDVYAFVEDMEGEIFLWREFQLYERCQNCFGDVETEYMLDTYKQLRYQPYKDVEKINHKIKSKIRFRENYKRVYIGFLNKPISYKEAKREELPVQFISHIFATLNKNVVFDYYLSPFIDYERTSFNVNNAKDGDVLNLFIEDIHGQNIHKTLEVKDKFKK